MEHSRKTISRVNLAVVLLLSGVQLGLIFVNIDPHKYRIEPFLFLSLAAFLVGMGNFLSKTEKNFFIGIRTPWTIASERNWQATHRFAAKWSVAIGAVLLMGSLFTTNMFVGVGGLLIATLTPVIYSYWFHTHYEQAR